MKGGSKCELREAVKRLLRHYGFKPSPDEFLAFKAVLEGMHPFGALVSIILTQNTSDRNAGVALKRLRDRLGASLTPKAFRRLSLDELAELIKPSGMQFIKAKTIKNLLDTFTDDELNNLEDLPPSEVREMLLKVKGIGPKTIDVFLLVVRDYPTFPVDTHIRRVLARLGCVREGASYEDFREVVIKELTPNLYLPAHVALITHGRRLCKARNPRCRECPIKDLCNYFRSRVNNS